MPHDRFPQILRHATFVAIVAAALLALFSMFARAKEAKAPPTRHPGPCQTRPADETLDAGDHYTQFRYEDGRLVDQSEYRLDAHARPHLYRREQVRYDKGRRSERIVEVRGEAPVHYAYVYDRAGRLDHVVLSRERADGVIARIGTRIFHYDARGRIRARFDVADDATVQTRIYHYGPRDRLSSVLSLTEHGAELLEYEYDAQGRRRVERVRPHDGGPPVTTTFHDYDAAGNRIASRRIDEDGQIHATTHTFGCWQS